MKALLSLSFPSSLAILLLGAGCSKAPPEENEYPTRPVVTALVPEPISTLERRFAGQVESAEGAPLAFESAGRVIAVDAKAGTRYEKGFALARVDDSNYQIQLLSAKAALTKAQQELRRLQNLFETENASRSDLDSAIASEVSARSTYELAEKALNDTILTMPYDGVIGNVDVEAQQVVSAGQVVMTIQGETGKEFEIGVPPEEVGQLEIGSSARVVVGILPDRELPAKIIEISLQVSANATYPVTLGLEKDDVTEKEIRAGMDGEAILELKNPLGPVIRVPAQSVAASDDGRTYVWIVEPKDDATEGTVTIRDVTTGALGPDGSIEILSGLNPKEQIVIRGVYSLDEGETVGLLRELTRPL